MQKARAMRAFCFWWTFGNEKEKGDTFSGSEPDPILAALDQVNLTRFHLRPDAVVVKAMACPRMGLQSSGRRHAAQAAGTQALRRAIATLSVPA